MKKYVLDRFEGCFAVLEKECGGTVNVNKKLLPDAQRNDVIIECDGIYRVDRQLTIERKKLIEEKKRRLFGKK